MIRTRSFILCIVISMSLTFPAFAQTSDDINMTGRLGVGANLALSGGMGISGKYWIADNIAVEGIFNFSKVEVGESSTTYFAIAGRGQYVLFDYGNTFGCVGGGIAFGNTDVDTGVSSNDETFFGLEGFFLVENMVNDFFSVSGQTGFSFINADDSTVLSVGTPSFIGMFGFHFYL